MELFYSMTQSHCWNYFSAQNWKFSMWKNRETDQTWVMPHIFISYSRTYMPFFRNLNCDINSGVFGFCFQKSPLVTVSNDINGDKTSDTSSDSAKYPTFVSVDLWKFFTVDTLALISQQRVSLKIIAMVSLVRYDLHLGCVYLYVQSCISYHLTISSYWHSSMNGIVGTWMFLNDFESFWI